ncbi:hypothetical protein T10_12223 [Trichinella papuae]|uniref:Uncharacterized protein n=1 Tax=Trichinella papuae TaxID=268474 RepID=A0A0V1MU05_9BILA|nr:hypothetical protein T10_12223 [Trichinella papuae]
MFKKFKLSRDKVEQWLADDDTLLSEILTDDEILKAVEKNENEDVNVSDKPNKCLSHSEAYSCLTVGLKSMEQQKEFSAILLYKQKRINDYIEYDSY